MAVIDVKNPTERNKLIAAILLGVVALGALYFAFGRSLFSSSTSAAAKSTPTPKPTPTPGGGNFKMPTRDEQEFDNVTTQVVYTPGSNSAPDPGRNIFAFYEPPPPTPYVTPPPPPIKTPPPPTPTPTPEFLVGFVNPQTVYAGSKGFKLEINGDRFTPDARIYFSQTELPTTYVSPQKLTTDIQAMQISQEGGRQIIVQTPDGKKYSNQFILTVQAPPRPAMQYIGMIGRKRFNNDTAYFIETGKTAPFGARLNDVVGGRFRLINISPAEVTFEDTSLGFKHKLPITQATAGSGTSTGAPGPNNFPPNNGFPTIPNNPNNPNIGPDCIPGIPCNTPRFIPQQPNVVQPPNKQNTDKKDVDDDGDG